MIRGLYAIVDPEACRAAYADPAELADEILQGGCAVLQLRAKRISDGDYLTLARRLIPLCHARNVPFIVNDRVHLVSELGADGVHLGQDDMTIAEARRRVGARIVGRSTHDLEQAQLAEAQGADWVAFGPVFATATKRDAAPVVGLAKLAAICAAVSVPVIAIGGIDQQNIHQVAAAGASLVAVISALATAAHPEAYVSKLQGVMGGER